MAPFKTFCFLVSCLIAMSSEITASLENMSVDKGQSLTLFDFTKLSSLDDWWEVSDTRREVGKSKAAFVIQKTQVFQRAIFFALLNPQPNGAGFAGYKTDVKFDLSNYTTLSVQHRAQGESKKFKVVLRHKGLNDEPNPSYEQVFEAKREFGETHLPLSDFKPFYRGKEQDPDKVGYLDKSDITAFEFQIFGGVYLPYKQSGPSTLEIDNVIAY